LEGQIADQFNTWWTLDARHSVPLRDGAEGKPRQLEVMNLVRWRRHDGLQDPTHFQIRNGIGGRIGRMQWTQGFDYFRNYPYGAYPVALANNEWRLWSQLRDKFQIFPNTRGDHRLRLDLRFRQRSTRQPDGNLGLSPYRLEPRFRYRLHFNTQFASWGEFDQHSMSFFWENEIFIQFGPNAGTRIFDQNRLASGLQLRVGSIFQINSGYMWQYLPRGNPAQIEANHTWVNTLRVFIDWAQRKQEPLNMPG
jgi:hypothetical protein